MSGQNIPEYELKVVSDDVQINNSEIKVSENVRVEEAVKVMKGEKTNSGKQHKVKGENNVSDVQDEKLELPASVGVSWKENVKIAKEEHLDM